MHSKLLKCLSVSGEIIIIFHILLQANISKWPFPLMNICDFYELEKANKKTLNKC